MENKVVLVTGASGGIGRGTAMELAKQGFKVIMASRNVEKGQSVRDEIIKETGNEKIVVRRLDLSSLSSVREFAAEINKTEPRLDILIHNAGTAIGLKPEKSVDNIEMTLATNHYGPFLLTHLLFDLLKKSAPSRIVIVASSIHVLSRLNLSKMNPIDTYPGFYYYFLSKRINIMFCRELARRIEGTGVTANCLHPGVVDSTGIFDNAPFPFNHAIKLFVRTFYKKLEEGHLNTIYVATSKELEGVSGKYYLDLKETELGSAVKNMEDAAKVWEISKEIVKLTEDDPKI